MEKYEELEQQFSIWNNLDPQGGVACSSGTAALHLALEALQLPQGSEVIVPDFNMIACPRAVTLAGLKPVFVDCTDNLLMSQNLAYHVVSIHTSAVMRVHLYGRQAPIWQRDTEGIKQIEDLAEAHGVKPHRDTDAACWSFYSNKIVCGAEGGFCWFKDPKHAELARSLRSLGFTKEHNFNHIPRGHNYRMSNLHAEPILKSLQYIDKNLEKRRKIEHWYDTDIPDYWKMPKRDVVWVYDLRIPGMTEDKQNKLVSLLKESGVAARHAFKPMSEQEEYLKWTDEGEFIQSNAHRLSREIIYLPVDPKMGRGNVLANTTILLRACREAGIDIPLLGWDSRYTDYRPDLAAGS